MSFVGCRFSCPKQHGFAKSSAQIYKVGAQASQMRVCNAAAGRGRRIPPAVNTALLGRATRTLFKFNGKIRREFTASEGLAARRKARVAWRMWSRLWEKSSFEKGLSRLCARFSRDSRKFCRPDRVLCFSWLPPSLLSLPLSLSLP